MTVTNSIGDTIQNKARPTQTIAALAQYVEETCRAEKIALKYIASYRASAFAGERRIEIPRVKGLISYFIALHEIGHVLDPEPTRRPKYQLRSEGLAWRWALKNARVPPDAKTLRKIHHCLAGYLQIAKGYQSRTAAEEAAGITAAVCPAVPPDNHFVWQLLAAIERRLGPITYHTDEGSQIHINDLRRDAPARSIGRLYRRPFQFPWSAPPTCP